MVDYPIFWGGIHKHFTRVHYLVWHLSRITDMLVEKSLPKRTQRLSQLQLGNVRETAWSRYARNKATATAFIDIDGF